MNKKLLITHIDDTLNYGSAMMAINLIHRLASNLGSNIDIYCECDEYNINRLAHGSQVFDLKGFCRESSTEISFAQKISKYILGNHESIKSITDNFDIMVVLGGDDLSETYKKGAILKGLVYRSINKKCKVILAGQSFGPFKGFHKTLAKFLYKNIAIITRDDNSFEFTKNKLGIKKVIKSRDLALLSLPNQIEFGGILNKIPNLNGKYITLVPSGLWKKYTSDKSLYIRTWIGILHLLWSKFPDHKIVLLGHVLLPEKSNDAVIINEMVQSMTKEEMHNIVPITQPIQPAEAREILGGSYLVVTGRMHAALSTFFMKKPAISLAYSEKYSGVIGRGLGLHELIIDSRNRVWGDDSEIINEVDKKINMVQNSYDELRETIGAKVGACREMVEDQIKFIVKEINNS